MYHSRLPFLFGGARAVGGVLLCVVVCASQTPPSASTETPAPRAPERKGAVPREPSPDLPLLPNAGSQNTADPGSHTAPAEKLAPGVALVQQLLDSLAAYDRNGRVPGQKLGFEIPESAVNEYLRYSLKRKPRPGIASAKVKFGAGNEVDLSADIDLSTVQEWNGQLIPEALRPMLHGIFGVKLVIQFEAHDGGLTFTLKEAQGPNGMALPKQLVLSALQTIGLHQPESFETTKPMPLPFGLKRIWIDARSFCGET